MFGSKSDNASPHRVEFRNRSRRRAAKQSTEELRSYMEVIVHRTLPTVFDAWATGSMESDAVDKSFEAAIVIWEELSTRASASE